MKNMKTIDYKFLFALFTITGLIFTSCKKDDEDKDGEDNLAATVAQDKSNVQASVSTSVQMFNSIESSEEMQAIETLSETASGILSIVEDYTKSQTVSGDSAWFMDKVISGLLGTDAVASLLPPVLNEYRLDPSKIQYKLTWDNASESFVEVAHSDGLMILFPHTEGGENNCEISILNYADQQISYQSDGISDKTMYLPTKGTVKMVALNKEVLKLDVKSITWANNFPSTADVSYRVLNLTGDISLATSGTKYTADVSITDGTESITLNAVVDAKKALDLNAGITREDYNSISGTFTFGNLGMNYNVADVATFYTALDSNMSAADLNSSMNVDVTYNSKKIAYLEAVDKAADDVDINIVYNDGSTEEAGVVFEPLLTEIEDFLGSFGIDMELEVKSHPMIALLKK